MKTPASIARHPIHPMLVVFPVALWVFSLMGDIVVHVSSDENDKVLWFMLSYYTLAGGLAGAVLAAIPGLIDYVSLRAGPVRKLASLHATINVTVVMLYLINLWLRTTSPPSVDLGFGLSLTGVALLALSGWIGGEMVHVHGVGVSAAATGAIETPALTARPPRGPTESKLGSA